MAEHRKKLSFHIPLKEDEAAKAVRFFDGCKMALDHCKHSSVDANAIYENPETVPPDLVDQLKRIDPCRLGSPGFLVSYEKTGHLWIRHDESANLEFLTRYLSEVVQETGLQEWGFEYSDDCSQPYVGAFGGGVMLITKQGMEHFRTYDMLCILQRMNEQRKALAHGLDPRRHRILESADQVTNGMGLLSPLPSGFALSEMDLEKFGKLRSWLEEALYAAGASPGGGSGIGMGQADVDIELKGSRYNVSIRPLPADDEEDDDDSCED
jgi:hypothetical protein